MASNPDITYKTLYRSDPARASGLTKANTPDIFAVKKSGFASRKFTRLPSQIWSSVQGYLYGTGGRRPRHASSLVAHRRGSRLRLHLSRVATIYLGTWTGGCDWYVHLTLPLNCGRLRSESGIYVRVEKRFQSEYRREHRYCTKYTLAYRTITRTLAEGLKPQARYWNGRALMSLGVCYSAGERAADARCDLWLGRCSCW